MNPTVFDDLASYFVGLADELSATANQGSLAGNSSDIGTVREDAYREFLRRHVPGTTRVFRGGYVFNLNGERSRQLDVIISAATAPRIQLPKSQIEIAPYEGTIAVAEVKSRLDKKALFDALEGCKSLPQLVAPQSVRAPYLKLVTEEHWWDNPLKIIFAYEGIKAPRLISYVDEFYAANGNTPMACRPSLIHVLGQYVAVRIAGDLKEATVDGLAVDAQPRKGSYVVYDLVPDVMALMHLLTKIQQLAFRANHMNWSYRPWLREVSLAAVRLEVKEK